MKSPNHKINELKIKHEMMAHKLYNPSVTLKLLYGDRLEQTRHRIKLNHSIDKCVNVDVAHGTIETIYAVFNRVMWLIISNVKRIINKIIGGLK